jgi:hypothetical protein
MKKIQLLLMALFAFTIIKAQTVEEIVKSYTKAHKLDQMEDISTIKISGTMSLMGMDMSYEMSAKKPDKMKVVINFQGQEIITAIDGNKGYTINPMTGSSDPVEIDAAQVEQNSNSNVFNNYVDNYLKKGVLTLEGTENVNDKPAFKLKAAPDTNTTLYLFIDKDSYMLVKTTTNMVQDGNPIEADTFFSEYKDTDGVMLPMQTTTSASGMEILISYDKIEVNLPMEDSMFKL